MGARNRAIASELSLPLPSDHPFRLVLTEAGERAARLRRTRYGSLDPVYAAYRVFSRDMDAFAALLGEHGLRPPRRGVSPFLPLLHLFFGASKSPRSKSRYARLLEFADANQLQDIGAYIRRAGGVDAILAFAAQTPRSAPRPARPAPDPRAGAIGAGAAGAGLTYAAAALGLLHQIDLAQAEAREAAALRVDSTDEFRFAAPAAPAAEPAAQANGDAADHVAPIGFTAPSPTRLLARSDDGGIDLCGQGAPLDAEAGTLSLN